nr:MAG TPA: hypothetical protein [Caudoviricetes sp.]
MNSNRCLRAVFCCHHHGQAHRNGDIPYRG